MKKYTTATRNRTVTFYAEDLETLDTHSTYGRTTTDMIQEAIKDYIRKQGWGEPSEPEQPATANPGNTEEQEDSKPTDLEQGPRDNPGETEDPTEALPDYLKHRRRSD